MRKQETRPQPPRLLQRLVRSADVEFNGRRAWDIQVRDPAFFAMVLRRGSLGLGDAYMADLWESEQLDETFHRLLRADLNLRIHGVARLRFVLDLTKNVLLNRQSRRRAYQVGERHYDIGNDVYRAMLDSSMSYSCGYWNAAQNLEQAQYQKLRLICEKLELRPGQRVLDIGCGWGSLARFAAEHYGVEVLGITVSREQQALAQERCRDLPVSIELMDYRAVRGRFDRVVSVGMFEHVGTKNYPVFFRTVHRVLDDQGLLLLHTIGDCHTGRSTDPWIDKYIFPNYAIPSAVQLTSAIEPVFLIEDWHNFGQDYDRTLMSWWANFDAAWPALREHYDQRFYRMWKYYLNSCAGYFRSRQGQLWQLVLAKRQRRAVYRSVR